REKEIGNEFVIAFDSGADQVKCNHAPVIFGPLFYGLYARPVRLEDRVKPFADLRHLDYFSERPFRKPFNDPGYELRLLFALDKLHQLERGRTKLDALRGRFIECSVDYVCPFDQFSKMRVLKAETFFGNAGNKLGTRGRGRI